MAGKAAGDAFFVLAGAQKSPGPQGSGAGGKVYFSKITTARRKVFSLMVLWAAAILR